MCRAQRVRHRGGCSRVCGPPCLCCTRFYSFHVSVTAITPDKCESEQFFTQFESYLTAGCVCMLVAPLWCELGCCSRTVMVVKAAANPGLRDKFDLDSTHQAGQVLFERWRCRQSLNCAPQRLHCVRAKHPTPSAICTHPICRHSQHEFPKYVESSAEAAFTHHEGEKKMSRF